MGIDPNIGEGGQVGGVGPVIPSGTEEQGALLNPLLESTLSPSEQEALMVLYMMNMPLLETPQEIPENYNIDIGAIEAMVASKFAEIGSNMWDKYIEYLEEQQKRIEEYKRSPEYKQQVEEDLTKVERAMELWSNMIDGVSNYIRDSREESPDAIPFMVASFVITSTFIGEAGIVDVSDKGMIPMNPIQSNASPVLDLIPPDVHELFNLTVNLFAMGLINFANVEAIAKAQQADKQPSPKEVVLAFAKEVLGKVKSNEINAFLMSILVSKLDPTDPASKDKLNEIVAIAKAIMIAMGIAALYKVETGWLTPEELSDILNGNMRFGEDPNADPRFLESYQSLCKELQKLQDSGVLQAAAWDKLVQALSQYVASKPSVDDMLKPMKSYTAVTQYLQNSELEG